MAAELLAFVAVSVVVIVTPGQDTALTIRNSLAGGRRGGVFTALGVATGQLAWTTAASLGVAAVLVSSEPAFDALRLAGAAYLVWLGGLSLLAAFRRQAPPAVAAGPRERLSSGTAYRQGLVSNLGNAKIAVFFTSLLPQLVPAGGASFWHLFPLGVLFAGMTLAWLSAYAAVITRLGDVIRRGRVRRCLDGVTGAALVAFGVRLAATSK
ncbi:MAG TPA: LysE family translocator [Gaiellaceae bacterium]|nr:LysE family translocator [Gaiellaceae bacterium]